MTPQVTQPASPQAVNPSESRQSPRQARSWRQVTSPFSYIRIAATRISSFVFWAVLLVAFSLSGFGSELNSFRGPVLPHDVSRPTRCVGCGEAPLEGGGGRRSSVTAPYLTPAKVVRRWIRNSERLPGQCHCQQPEEGRRTEEEDDTMT